MCAITPAGSGIPPSGARGLGPGAMGRFAAGFQFQPEIAFMRGDNLQPRRLAHNRKVRFKTIGRERSRTTLRVLLIDQPGENNLGLRGPLG